MTVRHGLYQVNPILQARSASDILHNFVIDPNTTWAAARTASKFDFDVHTTRRLHFGAYVGEKSYLTCFAWTGSSILKRYVWALITTRPCTRVLLRPLTIPMLKANRSLELHLDSRGLAPNLSVNWNFSLVFNIAEYVFKNNLFNCVPKTKILLIRSVYKQLEVVDVDDPISRHGKPWTIP